MRRLFQVLQATIPALVWVSAAAAQPGPHAKPSPVPPPRMEPGCVAECRHDVLTCAEGMRTDARACRDTCSTELAAVKEACTDDPTSDACKTARADARACLLPCAKARSMAGRNCRGDARSCLAECRVEPPTVPGPKDPVCAEGCASALHECLDKAREDAGSCPDDNCSELLDDMANACKDKKQGSEDCRLARRAAFDCLRSCRDSLRDDTQTCVRTANSCNRSCPTPAPEEPTPPAP